MSTSATTSAQSTVIAEIERLGFGWTEVSNYDLGKLDLSRRVQVRESNHYAPKDMVDQFVIQMSEVAFPPPVVTSDGWIVDGNTRVGARKVRKEKFTPAIVLDVNYESGATTIKQKTLLHALAATLNQTGGLRLTAKEIREVATSLVELGWKTEQIGRAIGLRPSSVTQVKREIAAVGKLGRVGMNANGELKGASLRALGTDNVVGLNDIPFRELATLAADAGFNASEITSTAKELRDIGSDTGAVDRVTSLRDEMNERIQERKLTGIGKPPVSRQLRQRLGFITKFVGRESELLETSPQAIPMHIEALTTAIAVLTDVLAAQK